MSPSWLVGLGIHILAKLVDSNPAPATNFNRFFNISFPHQLA